MGAYASKPGEKTARIVFGGRDVQKLYYLESLLNGYISFQCNLCNVEKYLIVL